MKWLQRQVRSRKCAHEEREGPTRYIVYISDWRERLWLQNKISHKPAHALRRVVQRYQYDDEISWHGAIQCDACNITLPLSKAEERITKFNERTCESTNNRVLSWHGATFSGFSSSKTHRLHVTASSGSRCNSMLLFYLRCNLMTSRFRFNDARADHGWP